MDLLLGDGIYQLRAENGYGDLGDGDPLGPLSPPRSTPMTEWHWNRSGFRENSRILKEIHDRSLNMCNSLCDNTSFDGNNETENKISDFESDSEFRASPSSPYFQRELLNKSVGSMQTLIAKSSKDQVRDLNFCGERSNSPKICKGVTMNSQVSVHQYDILSSEDEEEIERYKENRAVMIHNDTHKSAMARIEDMWDAFAIDDYAPWPSFRESMKLKRSQSLTKMDPKHRNSASAWKKRTTVPKPPVMLLRDADKTPRKTKAMIELDRQIEEKKRLEDLECQKKFKATPAPDHIRLNLFEEMVQQQEEKRRFVKENGEEILKSLQKPFEFIEREELKKQRKLKEFRKSGKTNSNGHFHARPFPSHIFNGTVEDKILEEEEYRQIRMKMRAEELLNSSVAPYSMRMQNWRRSEFKRRSRSEDEMEVCSFHPKVNRTIPDLDEQNERFMEQMVKCKGKKKPTACEPFNLRLSKPRRQNPHHSVPRRTDGVPRYESKNSRIASLDSPGRDLDRTPSKPNLLKEQNPASKKVVEKETPKKMIIEDANDTTARNGQMEVKSKNRQNTKFDVENGLASQNLLNRTYELDSRDPRNNSETSESSLWCHPSIVKRSIFWSDPSTGVR